jgi:hypothetical protein
MSKIEVDAIEPQSGTTLTIGASGDSVNIASGATITDFTSTGIDDNATSTAITIDSSERVGIGTASPAELLNIVGSSGDAKIRFDGDISNLQNNFIGCLSYDDLTIASDESNTGAASTIQFRVDAAECMRITSAGNVGIGTTSPNSYAGQTALTINNGGVARVDLDISDTIVGTLISESTYVGLFSQGASTTLRFGTNNTERMRIDSSGNVLFNCTSLPSASVSGAGFEKNVANSVLFLSSSSTSTSNVVEFFNPNGTVGTIRTSGSSTIYNTSSDYRLKENVNYDFDATSRLKQLKPARFNFIADANTTVDGFLAHEVQSVVPEAISGEKDAVNEDGSINPQGIDQSKLVPLLVKTIQELEARITTLENA